MSIALDRGSQSSNPRATITKPKLPHQYLDFALDAIKIQIPTRESRNDHSTAATAKGDACKIATINNPVIPSGGIAEYPAPDHEWFTSGDSPVILAVGRLSAPKDYPTLLQAFERVCRDRQARLVILGDGPEREKLERLAEELGIAGAVSMPGYASNPYAYMQHADLFVLSSAWEGSPNVLVEAMACGCPVVSTDCPSGPDQILEGGRYGVLVPVGAPELLAVAITGALDNPVARSKLLTRAADYSAEKSAACYLEVLLEGGASQ